MSETSYVVFSLLTAAVKYTMLFHLCQRQIQCLQFVFVHHFVRLLRAYPKFGHLFAIPNLVKSCLKQADALSDSSL